MISELFFYGKLKDVEDTLIYEEEFVLFYLNMQLLESTEFNKEKIGTLLEKLYGKENVKNNRIMWFCEKHFKLHKKNYLLNISEDEVEYYEKAKAFATELDVLINIRPSDLYEWIENQITNSEISFDEKLKKCLFYYYSYNDFTFEKRIKMLYRYFLVLKNYYKLYRIIDSKLENIPELFNSVEITELNISEQQQSFLVYNNVFTIKNLKHVPLDVMICIFCDDINRFINELGMYAINKEQTINYLYERLKNSIKPEWNIVIQKRYDINTNQKRTLADIGKELNLSRERIRQIESRIIQKFVYDEEELNRLISCFYKDINRDNNSYITVEELNMYLKDEVLTKYILVILFSEKIDMRVNEDANIIYNSKEITIEEIWKEAELGLDNIILKKDCESYDSVQKSIIKNTYRLYKGKVFVKKGLSTSYLYTNEIKENFMDGYDIGSKDDYEKLIKIIKDKYGDIETSSMHYIQGMVERKDFIQVDRGKYKAKEYTAALPEKLVDDIISFIIEKRPVIPYSLVYEEFKEQLNRWGINNRYYLKGYIDEKLPEGFNSKRDFINTDSENDYTTYDIMQRIFKSFEWSFTIEDVREKLPGLRTYNYEHYASLEEKNGLIQMGAKSYIYIDKLKITEDTRQKLKEHIDCLFIKLDSSILTAKKIYANLNIMDKDLFNKLNITSKFGDFELFSIIQYFYKDDYYFSRPIISKEEDFTNTTYMLVKEYVKKLNMFTYSDVKKYIYKMNLGSIQSYLNLMDDLSDEFIQINKDGMAKKEELNITNEQLKKIEEFLDMVLKNKELKLDDFDGYFILPRLARGWNKYLLVGIIKAYFKDKYDVINTTNFYDTTDYIVRRIN